MPPLPPRCQIQNAHLLNQAPVRAAMTARPFLTAPPALPVRARSALCHWARVSCSCPAPCFHPLLGSSWTNRPCGTHLLRSAAAASSCPLWARGAPTVPAASARAACLPCPPAACCCPLLLGRDRTRRHIALPLGCRSCCHQCTPLLPFQSPLREIQSTALRWSARVTVALRRALLLQLALHNGLVVARAGRTRAPRV